MLAPTIVYGYPVIFGIIGLAVEFVGRLHKAVLGGGAAQPSTLARITQWKMGIPLILHRPIGYGVGRGGETLGYFDPSGQLTIDSYYLVILLEYGVIGFAVYYGMLAAAAAFSIRWGIGQQDGDDPEITLLIPAGIAISAFLVTKSVFSNTDNHSLAFMILGMICALICRAKANAGVVKGGGATA
jgi:hypothetical protein